MKGENSDNNGSDFDRGNILKPTFDTLTKKGRKAFKAYLTDLKELLLLRWEMMRQGTVLRDTTSIIFNKPEITLEYGLNHRPLAMIFSLWSILH
jgi:hypothetical protein